MVGKYLIQYNNIIATLTSLLTNNVFLNKIVAKDKLTETDDDMIFIGQSTVETIKRAQAENAVNGLISEFDRGPGM